MVELTPFARPGRGASGTLLREDVRMKAPLLLIGCAHRQAETAHRETFAKLEVLLERTQTN